MLPHPPQISYEGYGKLSLRSKPVIHFLPVVNPETLQISNFELFMTIANGFQPLGIV